MAGAARRTAVLGRWRASQRTCVFSEILRDSKRWRGRGRGGKQTRGGGAEERQAGYGQRVQRERGGRQLAKGRRASRRTSSAKCSSSAMLRRRARGCLPAAAPTSRGVPVSASSKCSIAPACGRPGRFTRDHFAPSAAEGMERSNAELQLQAATLQLQLPAVRRYSYSCKRQRYSYSCNAELQLQRGAGDTHLCDRLVNRLRRRRRCALLH